VLAKSKSQHRKVQNVGRPFVKKSVHDAWVTTTESHGLHLIAIWQKGTKMITKFLSIFVSYIEKI